VRQAGFIVGATLFLLAGCNASEAPPDVVTGSASNAVDNATSEVPYCEAVHTEIPATECELVTHQLADLKAGMGNLTAPEEMKRGATSTVRFSVAPVGQSSATSNNSEQGHAIKPKPQATVSKEISIKIGRAMTATLDGPAFEITPTGEQSRDLGASNKADWIWTVKAKKGGVHPLYLTVSTKALDRKGKPTQLDLFTSEAEVSIKVTWWDRITDTLTAFTGLFMTTEGTLKALAAMLAALLAVVLAWRKLFAREKPQGD
jgi:hypothetical protein